MNAKTKCTLSVLAVFVLLAMVLADEARAQSYFYIQAGVGKNMMLFSDAEWEDQGSIGCAGGVGYRHHIGGNWYGDAAFMHYSQCFVGEPFNEKTETSSDHLYYFMEYRFYD